MSSPFNLAQSSLYDKRLAKIMSEGMDKYVEAKDTIATKWFKREITSDIAYRTTSVSTPQILRRLSENQNAPKVDIVQGYDTAVAWNRYGLGRELTWEAMKTDDSGELEKLLNEKIDTIKRSENYFCTKVIREGFNPGVIMGSGTSLITSSYPLRYGGTLANTFVDIQKPLSYDSLQEALTYMRRMRDHSGNPVTHSTKWTLVVGNHEAVRDTAFQLAGVEMKPGTDFNDSNFFMRYPGVQVNVVITDLICYDVANVLGEVDTSEATAGNLRYATQWFLVDEEMLMKNDYLVMPILKESNSIVRNIETQSLSQQTDLFHFFGFGVNGSCPWWIFGSKGTNLATDF